jgi:voltage-gated potassium channel
MSPWRRVTIALLALSIVLVGGTIGYLILGFGTVDAIYQTVTTVSTVGFREVHPLDTAGKLFTIVVILLGVGTTLYALGALIEMLVEGRMQELLGRRRMERNIASMRDHVIICGWGRVGRSIADELVEVHQPLVVIDTDETRVADCPHPALAGDATEDDTLQRAGIEHARGLIAAVADDAANLFVTLSARALRPDLFIVSRIRSEANEQKLRRAGADRVVNPQRIGGARMAAFVVQPNVAEFVDVVMHDHQLEFRLEEVEVPSGSAIGGSTLRAAALRDRTGALVLAVRGADGEFHTNPTADTVVAVGDILISIGTEQQLLALTRLVGDQAAANRATQS